MVPSDAPWLEVTSSALADWKLIASVETGDLAAGKYHATITIRPAQGLPTTVAVALTVRRHPILRTYSVIELGKLLGSLTGILAGFALTAAILLIEKSGGGGAPDQIAQASIASFFVAFATSLETAFNFSVLGAETENTVRLAVQLIPVSFGLSICIAYLFLGIALALFEYRVADRMREFVGLFCCVTLIFLGLNIAFSTLWSVAVWENKLLSIVTHTSPGYSYGLLLLACVPALIILLRISRSWRKPSARSTKFYIPIAMFSLVVVTLMSVVASFIAEEVPSWMQGDMRWIGGITVGLYVFVSGGAVAALPCYERDPELVSRRVVKQI
jgi:hypothetical protein